MTRSKRTGFFAVTIGALMLIGSGSAFALDCFIASRSSRGNAAAGSHSKVWVTVVVDDFAHGPDFPPGFDADCFVAEWLAGGGPASFTVRVDKVIGGNSSNPNLGNGSGLDHIETAHGALFGASLAACAL